LVHSLLLYGIERMKTKMNKFFLYILIFSNLIFSQGDFELEDLNPNSDTFSQLIGPGNYVGDICIIFFGHEY